MLVTEQEITELKKIVFQLNSLKDSVVVVEGKRDSMALKKTRVLGKSVRVSQIWRDGKLY